VDDKFMFDDNNRLALKALMERIIVIRADYFLERAKFEYTAISDMFSTIELGLVIPEYYIIFTVNPDKSISVSTK
jgi:hypothetical protein